MKQNFQKIKFYDDLERHIKNSEKDNNIIVMGDFNVAPTDLDIGIGEQNVKRWLREGKTAFLPEEIEMWNKIKNLGFVDHGECKIQMRIQYTHGSITAQECLKIIQKED